MRRQLLVMLVLVAAVDAIAIATWFLAGLRGRSGGVQLFATLGVVLVSMRKFGEAGKR
jgi:hypothetical protein